MTEIQIGQRFGMYTVIGAANPGPRGDTKVACRCDCGTERSVLLYNLKNGGSTGCGCRAVRGSRPVIERLLARVAYDHGCWSFLGTRTKYGHGRVSLGRAGDGSEHAHRVAYRELVGPISGDAVVDHLCRNPACVNPDHLEVVTREENFRRGISHPERQHAATHCKRGHRYTAENTRWLDGGRRRSCKDCERARRREEAVA